MGGLPMLSGPLQRHEFREIACRLETFHELFRALWDLGEPVFTETIDTAAVAFDSEGAPLRFLFNPAFWEELPTYDRDFVICHEMLHAVLNHGFRGLGLTNHAVANVAADIAVNHLLVSRFGFIRELLRDWSSICWVDTVFNSRTESLPATNLTMEEYYALLMSRKNVQLRALVDEHFFRDGQEGSLNNEKAASELEARLSDLDPEVRRGVGAMLGAEGKAQPVCGTQQLGAWCRVEPVLSRPVPWEKIVRSRIVRPADPDPADGWVIPPRRLGAAEELITVGTMERQQWTKGVQRCVFFLDASGSTWELRDRFFGLALSLPVSQFLVELCSFDTEVYPLDIKRPEVCGGGGTSFDALERWLLARTAGPIITPYPDVVIVLTDGMGGPIEPRYPKRWHWLLTECMFDYIPKMSVIYLLRKFA